MCKINGAGMPDPSRRIAQRIKRRLPLTDRLEQERDSVIYADSGPIGRAMPDHIGLPAGWADRLGVRGPFAVRVARQHVDQCTKMRHIQSGQEKGVCATLAAL